MALSAEMKYLKSSLSSFCVLCNGGQHTDIQIVENDVSAKLKKVNIKAENGDWFCFSPDKGRYCKHLHRNARNVVVMSPLLEINSEFSHHCACDAVLLLKKEERVMVLYMDLKSGNPNGYCNQFKSTRQFVKYLVSLHNEFQDQKIHIAEERYIIFYGGTQNISLQKQTTTFVHKQIKNTTPDNAYKRFVKNDDWVYLKEFIL